MTLDILPQSAFLASSKQLYSLSCRQDRWSSQCISAFCIYLPYSSSSYFPASLSNLFWALIRAWSFKCRPCFYACLCQAHWSALHTPSPHTHKIPWLFEQGVHLWHRGFPLLRANLGRSNGNMSHKGTSDRRETWRMAVSMTVGLDNLGG